MDVTLEPSNFALAFGNETPEAVRTEEFDRTLTYWKSATKGKRSKSVLIMPRVSSKGINKKIKNTMKSLILAQDER